MVDFLVYMKQKLQYNFTMEWYNFLYYFHPKQKIQPRVASIVETLEKVAKDRCSVSRFGDGEMLVLSGRPIRFQKVDKRLSEKLIEVIQSDNEKHLVCLSDTFREFKTVHSTNDTLLENPFLFIWLFVG